MWPTWLRSIGQRLAGRSAAVPAPEQTLAGNRAAPAPAPLKQRARFEEMEPRLLYSADSPAAWLPSAVVQVVPSAEVQVVPPAISTPVQTAPVAQASRELVIIDAGVTPTQALIDGLRAARPATVQLQVVVLQPGSDGLQQVSLALAQQSGLAAVHIVAHGEQAALQLGSTRLDAAALAHRSAELQAWRSALTDDADLLLYGCDVAAGDTGAAFIQRLAGLTGADVAASTNATGAAAAGGDWVLEARVGSITSTLAAVQPLLQAMDGVLGLAPVGGEVRANTDATGAQSTSIYGGGNVAMDSNGNHVVVWNDARTNSGDIYFQRYDAAGAAQGANTLVNTTTANQQDDANVAMDANGNFVVVWASDTQDGSSWGIYARRFDATGAALGAEFRVNSTTTGLQVHPAVAMSASGSFVVAWTDASSGNNDIRAQRYNASGVAQGGEIAVNSTTSSAQQYPSVAMATSGDFVVAWESDQSTNWGVYVQRFNASGTPQGGELVVNTYVAGTQWNVAAAADSAGNFVLVWDSSGQDPGGSSGIYGQRYNASGVPQGLEFRVNTTTADAQTVPAVAMNAAGDFVVTWNSDLQDGSGAGVYAQAFDAAGAAVGGELRVASTSSGTQQTPAVAYVGSQAVVAWNGNGTGDAQGVFVRQLQTTAYNRVVVENSSDVVDGDTSSITALTNDKGADGAISLREALLAANNTPNAPAGPDHIEFDISGTGPHTIQPAVALPDITDAVVLDATTSTDFTANGSRPVVVLDGNNLAADGLVLAVGSSGSTVRGLVVRDFGSNGIRIDAGSNSNLIVGNYLGQLTPAGGDAGVGEGNGLSGLWVASGSSGNTVGGSGSLAGNVASGNGQDGMDILGPSTLVQGNLVGTDATGTVAIGNGQDGISLGGGNNQVGGTGVNEGNLIANSVRAGVDLWTSATGNTLLGNRFSNNGGLALDLGLTGVTANDTGDADTGTNNLQNFPVLATARTNASNQLILTGTLNSTANGNFRIEFFANTSQNASGYGEGQTYLGFANVATDGAGNATINSTLAANVAVGSFISTTATKATDNSYTAFTDTSEFARNIAAVDSTQATVTVTTTSDTSDGDTASLSTLLANPGADGYVSLREAMTAANNTANGTLADKIAFNITGTGVHTITPLTALPAITNAVVLDASTDDSFAANSNRPAIVLDGNDLAASGLVLSSSADGSTLRGLLIRDFAGEGIQIDAGADGNTLEGNYIGSLLSDGSSAGSGEANASEGVLVFGANNTIGGTTAAARNVISGNGDVGVKLTGAGASGNLISGNFIGLNAAGTVALGNTGDGISLRNGASGNTVGGATTAHRNVISANGGDGVQIIGSPGSSSNTVRNNYVGTDVTGTLDRGNTDDGIDVDDGSNNNLLLDNLVAGNNSDGFDLGGTGADSSGTVIRGNLIGTQADGVTALGNSGHGVRIGTGATANNTLVGGTAGGQGNTIRSNGLDGIFVDTSTGVAILGNAIAANGGLGIDLGANGVTANDLFDADSGANNLQNFPVLTSANSTGGNTTITGSISSNASTSFRIEFFSSPAGDASNYGEALVYLGSTSVSTNGLGTASIGTVLTGVTLTAGHVVSATATVDLGGGNYGATSELAANVSASASAAGITVGAISGNTSEAGASATFTVVLDTAPLADVQVPVISSNGLEGSVSTALLTFNILNWATPQVVTVFGEDDTLADGNRAYSVVLGAASSSDGAYNGLDAADVAVTNTDNDTVNTVFVTTTADTADGDTSSLYALLGNKGADGQISLREAMTAANNTANGSGGADRVHFNISGTGVHTLNVASALPVVTGALLLDGSTDDSFAANSNRPAIVLDGNDGAFQGLVLGATADGSTIKGLVVRDFGLPGIWVQAGSDNNSIVGNYIGALDTSGQFAAGEAMAFSNLFIEGSSNTVGGVGAAARNVISGATRSGVWLETGSGNTVVGNYIGLAADGVTVIGNGWNGIQITTGSNNRIGGTAAGEGNQIAGAGDDGIGVLTGTGNTLLGNTITGSASLGIELGINDSTPVANDPGDGDTGGNNLQNFPVLATARTDGSTQLVLTGSMDGIASTGYRIEFFANAAAHASGHGEGQRYLGSANVTTDGSGQATFNASLAVAVAAGESISATATRANAGFTVFSDTSEFALNAVATLAPVLTTSGTPLVTTENDPATPVDAALTVTDGDSANLSSATVTITGNYALGQDLLGFSNQLGITGSWNAGSGQLTLTGSASVASYQTALRSVSYSNSSDAPSTLARTVSFVVNDGVAPSATATRSVTVAAVNDAPAVSTTGSTLVVAENDAATPVDAGLVVSDADSANLSGATVSFTANYINGEDLLLFTNQLGISGSWNAGTGVLTLSGTASVASYQAALRTVSYLNNSEAPDTAVRTLAFDVTDGALGSTAATRDLQVTPVNDAPLLDNTAAMQLSTISRTNSTNSGNTVAQVIGSVGGDRITDVDSAALEGVALTATTTAGLGAWQFSLDGGTTWQAVGAVNTNAALLLRDTDRIRFVPSGAANGQATITFRAWDTSTGVAGTTANASTAGGTSAFSTSTETATLNVVESTGGPVAVADTAQTQVGAAVPINVLGNDLDPQGDPLTVLDVSNPANGSVSLGGGGTVTYTPTGGFSGTDTFGYLIRDANDDMAHYWKLDGSAGDSVGAGNGTLVNGPATVAGVYGSALQFDGVNDHVALPDLSYSNEFTLSFRFRVDDNTGSQIQYFYSHGAVPTSGQRNLVHVGLVEDANAVFGQRNHLITTVFDSNDATDASGQLLVDVAALIGDGQWHQYTATVTPGMGTQVYVDGVLRGSVNRGGDAIDPVGGALLGARSDLEPTRYLNGGGRMDSVALFNRALSGSEVAAFYSGGTQQASVTVNVNATPVVSASGGTASYTENGAPVVLDAGLLVSDANSAQLAGATVSISSNYVLGQDSLQFTTQLGIAGSWNVGSGELVLSGNASVASYQAALRSVTYVNSSEAPDTTARVLSFVVDDGLVPSAAATRNLVVTAVNDAPTASGLAVAEVYTEDTALNLNDIVASDVDNSTGSVTLTLSNPAAGVLSTGTSGAVTASFNAGTGVWTASGALVDVNALLAALSFTPALNFNAAFSIATSVSDGVAAPVTGSKAFTGVPVNDAPTASGLNTAESYTEDTPLNLAAIVASDVDNATLTVTLTLSDAAAGALSTGTSGSVTSTYGPGTGVWTASGAVANVNALLAGLVFTPASNYISSFSIGTSVSDGLAAPVTGSKTISVVLVNDAPTASNLNAAETTPEDTALDLTDIVVADVDNANLAVTLTLSNPVAGTLSTGSAGAVTASFNAGTGVWTASGAVADVNSLLAALVFTPAPDFNGSLNIATRVSDGTAAAVTGSKTVVVVPVNDAPTASNLGGPETYTEDTPLNLGDMVVTDIDSSSGSVTLTLSNPAVGALATGTSGAVTSTFNGATGVWAASGAIADINNLLAALVFTPAPNFNGNFSVASSVSDGVAAAISGSKDFTGVAVNDAPTASNLNTAQNYTEDQPLSLTAIVAGDIDSASVTARLTLSNAAAGALSTGSSGAVTSQFNAASGVWQASGALADVNALLAAVAFQPAPDFNAAFSIATSISDGVAVPITGVWSMTGAPVNDAPTASNLNQAETYTEDTPLNLADIVVSDIDSSSGSVSLTLSSPTVGTLATGTSGAVTSTFNASTGVWSASGAIADINTLLAALVFTPAADFNGSFGVATSVSDGVAAAISGNKAFTGVAVNDAPTASNLNTAQSYTEDQPLNLAAIVAGDIDSASITARLTLSNPAAGALTTGTSGAVTSLFDAATGVWQASGALADVNALLAAAVFQPSPDFNAAFGIATRISDGVAAPITGLWSMTGMPVNDAPTTSGMNTAVTYTEDTRLTLAGLAVADIDSAVLAVRLTLSDPAVGGFSIGVSGAVASTFDAATGVWSASGALADVNTLLAAVQFVPALNVNGGFSVAIWVSDGVAAALAGSKLFSGVAVNDAPVLNTLGGLAVDEGSLTPLGVAQLQAGDVDNTAAELTYTLVSEPVHGRVQNNGQLLAVGDSFTQADLNAGRVAYRHDASETTADALDFSLSDGQATGASGRVTFAITPVNDEVPRITSPVAGVTVPENTTAVALVTATDADLPPQTLQFAIAGGADAAAFTINASTGELSFIAAPDFEAPLDSDRNNVYLVDLRVSDGELSSISSRAVTVAPVNDNTPRLTSSGGAAQALLEVQEGNQAVLNLTAADADQPPAALVYAIVGGADAARFTVNAASGALRFVDAPLTIDPRDRDADNVYQVVVQASDGSRLAQQALSIKVRATLSTGASNGPSTVQTPQAPTHYSGGPVQEDAAAAPAVIAVPVVRPIEAVAEEEPLVPLQNRRTALVRLVDAAASRSRENAHPLVAAVGLGEGSGSGVDPSLPGQDTGSLEAALGLPGTEATFLQVRPDGLSLAGLAAQTAVRSSTAVPGPLTLAQPLGDAHDGADDNDTIVQALAAPVVAGGMALSASLLVWATRAGGLAAAMMASVPAWRSLDPLPILARNRARDEGDGADSGESGGLAGRPEGAGAGADSRADTASRMGPVRNGPVDPPFDAPDDPVPGQPAPRTPPPAALRELLEPLEAMP